MENVPVEDLDKPLSKGEKKPLPLLPELTMLNATITEIKLEYAMFQGKQQFVTDYDTKEVILDANNQPIPRKEFNVTFSLPDFTLVNGEPRKVWLRLGASVGEKAKLTKFLKAINVTIENPTPKGIINALTGQKVKFQLVNKPSKDGTIYQNINFESIRPLEQKQTINPEDIAWKD